MGFGCPIVTGKADPEHAVSKLADTAREYAFAMINKRRVLIEPETRKIIKVY